MRLANIENDSNSYDSNSRLNGLSHESIQHQVVLWSDVVMFWLMIGGPDQDDPRAASWTALMYWLNPHLSLEGWWFPSLNPTGGWSIDQSLFMETQLGPGESALCCLLLKNKHHLEIRICGYLFVLSFIAGLLNYFLLTFDFNNLCHLIGIEI